MAEKKSPLSKIGCLIPLVSSGGVGCAFLLIISFLAIAIFTTNFGGGQTGGGGSSSGTPLSGINGSEAEVYMTHYYPCTPDFIKVKPSCDPSMEGDESTAIGGIAVYDTSSPMGFYVNMKGKRYDYQFASSQHKPEMIELSRNPKKGVVFDDPNKVFVTFDHFGSCMNKPTGMDILATDEGYSKFFANIQKAGLVIERGVHNGCGQSTKVKGTLVDVVEAGATGKAPAK
jgi:hypothetical protein